MKTTRILRVLVAVGLLVAALFLQRGGDAVAAVHGKPVTGRRPRTSIADLPPPERLKPRGRSRGAVRSQPGSYRDAASPQPIVSYKSLLTSTLSKEFLELYVTVTPLDNGQYRWRFELRNPVGNHQRVSQFTIGGWPFELPSLANLDTPSGWSVQVVRDSLGEGAKINLSVLPNQTAASFLHPGNVLTFGFDLPLTATSHTGRASAIGTVGFSGNTLGYQPPPVRFALDGIAVTPEAPTICEGVTGTLRVKPAAPAGGLWVTLQSGDPSVVAVEDRVWVAPGESEKRFSLTLRPVPVATAVTVTAKLEDSRATTSVTVHPPRIQLLFPSNREVPAGATLTAILTLECRAPWPLPFTLKSDNPIVQLPCSVTMAAGEEQVIFPVETLGLKAEPAFSLVTAHLSATASIGTAIAPLQVRASSQLACTLDICPGYSTTGEVVVLMTGEGGRFLIRYAGPRTPVLRTTSPGAAPEEYTGNEQLVEVTRQLDVGGPHWIELLQRLTDGTLTPAAAGTVFVQRLNRPENARPLAADQMLGGIIPRPAHMESFVVTATAPGERIVLQGQSTPDLRPQLRLYDPNGVLIATASSEEDAVPGSAWRHVTLSQTAPAAGQYTCLLGDQEGIGTGSYALTRGSLPCLGLANP